MKVTTCLNPLHTALAVFGCVMGYETICAEMGDPLLKKLVERIGYVEGLPVVVSPGIIDPKTFIDEVVNERLPNVFLPDTPQRIATDTSQKLAIRFGETIKAHVARGDVDAWWASRWPWPVGSSTFPAWATMARPSRSARIRACRCLQSRSRPKTPAA